MYTLPDHWNSLLRGHLNTKMKDQHVRYCNHKTDKGILTIRAHFDLPHPFTVTSKSLNTIPMYMHGGQQKVSNLPIHKWYILCCHTYPVATSHSLIVLSLEQDTR